MALSDLEKLRRDYEFFLNEMEKLKPFMDYTEEEFFTSKELFGIRYSMLFNVRTKDITYPIAGLHIYDNHIHLIVSPVYKFLFSTED